MSTPEEFVMLLAACAILLIPVWMIGFGCLALHFKGRVGLRLWCGALGLATLVAAVYLLIPIYNMA
jgi:hypothetical protein